MRLIAISIIVFAGSVMAAAGTLAESMPDARRYSIVDECGLAVVAVGLAVALTVALILLPHLLARLFGPRCLNCGHRPLDRFDYGIFSDPAPEWSLFRCARCASDFIRSSGQLTPRSEWGGDPDAARTFQELDADGRR